MTERMSGTPGSDSAVKAGCTCPIMDNAHGKGIPIGKVTRFWIGQGCPIHDKPSGDNANDRP